MSSGFLLINKPVGMNSTRAVTLVKLALKKLCGNKSKVGHAGTLDPLASGLLIIAVGEATKLLQFVVDADKTYDFTIRFGEERSTGDLEGNVTAASNKRPTEAELMAILPEFIGEITQYPPVYSAIKIGGKRAYELARRGEEVEIPPRNILIKNIKLNDFRINEADLSVDCSKGTYVRSLARDISVGLGCFGFASVIHRTRIGKFSLSNAFLLENSVDSAISAIASLLPIEAALDDIPAVSVDGQISQRLRQGQAVSALELASLFPKLRDMTGNPELFGGTLVAVLEGEKLVAITEFTGSYLKPRRVFNG